MRRLDVYWDDSFVGVLEEADEWSFSYADTYKGPPISASFGRPGASGPRVYAFFENLLPEAQIRAEVARSINRSSEDTFGLLEALGGEIAGALTLLPPGHQPENPSDYEYVELTDAALRRLIQDPGAVVRQWVQGSMRLSLAGAQSKIPVLWEDGRLWLPTGSEPTTHLLKFPNSHYRRLPENEAFCLLVGRTAELDVVESELIADGEALLVERFDRRRSESGDVV